MRPFVQLPFRELPDAPRVPHGYLGLEPRDVIVNSEPFGSVRIRYRVLGEGPPLLLLHGLMTSGYSFRYVVEPLAKSFTCYIPDLVGSGESDKPDRPYSAPAYSIFLLELIDALGIRGTDVVANSMAGYLAMQAAIVDPRAMKRLVNIHSPGVPLKRLHALRFAMSIPIAEPILKRIVRLDIDRWIHRNVHYYDETLKSREECRIYGAPLRESAGLHAFARILGETLDPVDMQRFVETLEDMKKRGEPFPIPLYLLYADDDPMVPPVVGERLRALLPSATFKEIKQTSHFMHVDTPQKFLDAALPFLGN